MKLTTIAPIMFAVSGISFALYTTFTRPLPVAVDLTKCVPDSVVLDYETVGMQTRTLYKCADGNTYVK